VGHHIVCVGRLRDGAEALACLEVVHLAQRARGVVGRAEVRDEAVARARVVVVAEQAALLPSALAPGETMMLEQPRAASGRSSSSTARHGSGGISQLLSASGAISQLPKEAKD
jgi:hypothetical protein